MQKQANHTHSATAVERCHHCLDIIPKGGAIVLPEQPPLKFCCNGCLAVYQFLQENPDEKSAYEQSIATSNTLSPQLYEVAKKKEKKLLNEFMLSVILFAQLGLFLLVLRFSSSLALSSSTKTTLTWLSMAYLLALLFISLASLLRQIRFSQLDHSIYPIALMLSLLLFSGDVVRGILGQSAMFGAILAVSLLALLASVTQFYWQHRVNQLASPQTQFLLEKVERYSNYYSALHVLLAVLLFLYLLPQSVIDAYQKSLWLLLLLSPMALRLMLPLFLHTAKQAVNSLGVSMRSAVLLWKLSRIQLIVLGKQAMAFADTPSMQTRLKRKHIKLQALDTSSENSAAIQLRLLQQQESEFLLWLDDEVDAELLVLSDISLRCGKKEDTGLTGVVDIVIPRAEALAALLNIAQYFRRCVYIGGALILLCQLALVAVFLINGSYTLLAASLCLACVVLGLGVMNACVRKLLRGLNE